MPPGHDEELAAVRVRLEASFQAWADLSARVLLLEADAKRRLRDQREGLTRFQATVAGLGFLVVLGQFAVTLLLYAGK